MRYRTEIVASILTIAGMAAVGIWAWELLPAGTRLPTHWGANGLPDRFSPADTALLVPVLFAAVASAVMAVLPSIEPLQRGMEGSAPLYRTAWVAFLVLSAFIELLIAAPAFGLALGGESILAAVGILFVFVGNALPKSRPGFFVGIRTPWTLSDPDNWIATHRLAGPVTMTGGAVMTVAALLPIGQAARMTLFFAAVAALVVIPVVYSFMLWRRGSRGPSLG